MERRIASPILRPWIALVACALAGPASADGSGKWQSAQETYQKVCAYCHERGLAPVIRNRGAPSYFREVVRTGRLAMPPFRPTEIDDATLDDLMLFLRGGPATAGNVGNWKTGKQVYDQACASCHDTGGKRAPAIKGRGAPHEFRQTVRTGKARMPVFPASDIDDRLLAEVMDYIR